MADEEAVEARRRKLRLLEQSLFGGEGDSAVALPQVGHTTHLSHLILYKPPIPPDSPDSPDPPDSPDSPASSR